MFKSKSVYVMTYNVLYTVQKLRANDFLVANVYTHHTHRTRQHRHYHTRENVSNDVSVLLMKLKLLVILSEMLMYYMDIICLITV